MSNMSIQTELSFTPIQPNDFGFSSMNQFNDIFSYQDFLNNNPDFLSFLKRINFNEDHGQETPSNMFAQNELNLNSVKSNDCDLSSKSPLNEDLPIINLDNSKFNEDPKQQTQLDMFALIESNLNSVIRNDCNLSSMSPLNNILSTEDFSVNNTDNRSLLNNLMFNEDLNQKTQVDLNTFINNNCDFSSVSRYSNEDYSMSNQYSRPLFDNLKYKEDPSQKTTLNFKTAKQNNFGLSSVNRFEDILSNEDSLINNDPLFNNESNEDLSILPFCNINEFIPEMWDSILGDDYLNVIPNSEIEDMLNNIPIPEPIPNIKLESIFEEIFEDTNETNPESTNDVDMESNFDVNTESNVDDVNMDSNVNDVNIESKVDVVMEYKVDVVMESKSEVNSDPIFVKPTVPKKSKSSVNSRYVDEIKLHDHSYSTLSHKQRPKKRKNNGGMRAKLESSYNMNEINNNEVENNAPTEKRRGIIRGRKNLKLETVTGGRVTKAKKSQKSCIQTEITNFSELTVTPSYDMECESDDETYDPNNKNKNKKRPNACSKILNNSTNICFLKQKNIPQSDTESQQRRAVHNKLERQRRDYLKNLFEALRKLIPAIENKPKSSKVQILAESKKFIDILCTNFESKILLQP